MGTVTMHLELVQADVESKFSTLAHRGHIEKRIRDLANAESKGHKSACMVLSAQIKAMFENYGVKCKADLKAAGYKALLEKSDIPSFSEMEPRFWETIYSMFEEFPSPTEYIEKMVDTLGDPLFKADSLRLRILKQFIKYTDYLKYTPFFSENFKADILEATGGDISKIDDALVERLTADKGKVPAYDDLSVMIQKMGPYIRCTHDEIDKIYGILCKLDNNIPSQAELSFEEMCAVVVSVMDTLTQDTPESIELFEIFSSALERTEKDSVHSKEINNAFTKKYNDYIDRVSKKNRRTRLKFIIDSVFLGVGFDCDVCVDHISRFATQSVEDFVKLPVYIDGKEVSADEIQNAYSQIRAAVSGVDTSKPDELYGNLTAFFREVSAWVVTVKPKNVVARIAVDILDKVLADTQISLEDRATFYKKHFRSARKAYANSLEYKLEGDEKYLALVKLCDDLAEGVFRTNGAPKKALYPFAVAFGMRYYENTDDASYDVNFDIDKNLFKDYYCDNIIRFIGSQSLRIQEAEPSGIGINYKNFAEVIYLYYLSKGDEYTPAEKIKKINKLINKIKTSVKDEKAVRAVSRKETKHFRNTVISQVLSLQEKDLEEYIVTHFNCNIYSFEDKKYLGVFQLEDEENSAWTSYSEIMDILSDDYDCFNPYRENLYEQSEDVFGTATEVLRKLEDIFYDKEKYPSGDNFLQLIKFTLSKLNLTDLDISKHDAEDVSRTKIIAAYFYLYFFLAKSGDESETWDNYKEFFEGFSAGVDPYLEDAYYQPISFKNIFDSIVAFLCYRIVNAEFIIDA